MVKALVWIKEQINRSLVHDLRRINTKAYVVKGYRLTSFNFFPGLGKFVQALQALLSARELDQSDPGLHVRIIDYHNRGINYFFHLQ